MAGRIALMVAITVVQAVLQSPLKPVRHSVWVPAMAARSRVWSGGTVRLSGVLGSTVTVSTVAELSVGPAENLIWDLPSTTSVTSNGYTQTVESLTYTYSVPPDSQQDTTSEGMPVHRAVWLTPSEDTVIQAREVLRVHISSRLTPFTSTAAYPLRPVGTDPAEALALTPATSLSPSARATARALAVRKTREAAVVEGVVNWVAAHVAYSLATDNSAQTVYAHRAGSCEGYVNLAIAMLRADGIPARAVVGWNPTAPLRLRKPDGSLLASLQWGASQEKGGGHTWIEVYFPDAGWTSFDPQVEKFFVDPRHIAFYTTPDASQGLLTSWTATPLTDGPATGAPLADGSTMIAAFDEGSHVHVHTEDHVALTGVHFSDDVREVTLLSRAEHR